MERIPRRHLEKYMKRLTLALGALVLAGAAAAEPTPFQWSADDLVTLEGIAQTHQRIQAAANNFCRDHLRGSRGLSSRRQCIVAIEDEIVAGIGDRRLTAYARTGTVEQDLLATVAPQRASD
jgi:UrcA family protein